MLKLEAAKMQNLYSRAKAMEAIMFYSAFQGHTRDKTLENIPGLAQTCGSVRHTLLFIRRRCLSFFFPTNRCFKCLEYYSRYPGDQMSSLPLNTNSWESDSLVAAVMVSPFVPRESVSDISSRYPDPSVIVLGCRDTPHPFFCYPLANHPETGRLISMKLDNIM